MEQCLQLPISFPIQYSFPLTPAVSTPNQLGLVMVFCWDVFIFVHAISLALKSVKGNTLLCISLPKLTPSLTVNFKENDSQQRGWDYGFLRKLLTRHKRSQGEEKTIFPEGPEMEGAIWELSDWFLLCHLGYPDTIVGSDNWVLYLQVHNV